MKAARDTVSGKFWVKRHIKNKLQRLDQVIKMKKFYSYDEILEYVKSSDADSIYNYIEYLEGIRRDKIYGLVWAKQQTF